MYALGHLRETWLDTPKGGEWPYDNYPEEVWLRGHLYRRAIWRRRYAGVVEQYREAVDRGSRHLLVFDDDTYRVEHVDAWNPDRGFIDLHLRFDHVLRRRR